MSNENLITPAPVTTPVDPAAVAAAPVVVPVAPVAVPAPVVAEIPAPAATVAPEAPATVLGEALSKEPVKEPIAVAPKVEAKVEPVVEQKTKEGQSEEPAPPPVYDEFKVPEGETLDKERIGKFTSLLGELESKAKVDHKAMQEFGQKAVDFHVEEVRKLNESYAKAWERQKTEWKDSFLKDPEIGGNRFQTTVDSALTFIRTHGGTAEQQTEFRNLMESSGLGNHPAMIRILANAGKAMSEGKPLAASKPVPAQKSKVNTLYGDMS